MFGKPDEPRIFKANEPVWWDEEQLSDPVVFQADLVQFEANRTAFLKSVQPFAVRPVNASRRGV